MPRATETINATDAARRLSEILNRVRYQGQSFEVKRGGEVVARIVPATTPSSIKVVDLPRLFAELPPLPASDRKSMERNLRGVRKRLSP